MSLVITDIVTSLGDYSRKSSQQIRSATLGETQITKYFTTVTDVDDEYWLSHTITDRVVFGFKNVWNAAGNTTFKPNLVKAYHFKSNISITPSSVWKSWLSFLANEKLDITQYPITKYITENEIGKAISRDRDYLLCKGVYNASTYDTVFGAACDGINEKLRQGIVDGSMYRIQLPTFASNNAVSNVERFVKKIPVDVRDMMDFIFMNTSDLDAYKQDYRTLYGQNADYTREGLIKEYFSGLPLVGLPHLEQGRIWTTYADNRKRVVNKTNQPILTDVQKADYAVKAFYEWFEGLGFHINQHVFVSVPQNVGYDSGLTSDTTLYFPAADLT